MSIRDMNYYHHVQHYKRWTCTVYIYFLYFVISFLPFNPLKLSFLSVILLELFHWRHQWLPVANSSEFSLVPVLYLCVLVAVDHFLLLMPNSLCSHDPAHIWFLCFSDHPLCLLCKNQFLKGRCSPGLSSGPMDLLRASPWACSTFRVSALTCLLISYHGLCMNFTIS